MIYKKVSLSLFKRMRVTVSADRGADMSLLQTGLKGEDRNEVTLEYRKEH